VPTLPTAMTVPATATPLLKVANEHLPPNYQTWLWSMAFIVTATYLGHWRLHGHIFQIWIGLLIMLATILTYWLTSSPMAVMLSCIPGLASLAYELELSTTGDISGNGERTDI